MGQFAHCSPVEIWNCCPILRGVGVAMVVIAMIISIYYNVIMSYALEYMEASLEGLFGDLPWTVCSECLYTFKKYSQRTFKQTFTLLIGRAD